MAATPALLNSTSIGGRALGDGGVDRCRVGEVDLDELLDLRVQLGRGIVAVQHGDGGAEAVQQVDEGSPDT